jgi:transposase
MDSLTMGSILSTVSRCHSNEFIIMVIDGAPSHRSGQLIVPENMTRVRLPPYSPELNPVVLLGDELREKNFSNRVFIRSVLLMLKLHEA